jgi:hypothetical protein
VERRLDHGQEGLAPEGLREARHRPEGVGFAVQVKVGTGRQEDHGNGLGGRVGLQAAADLVAVHLGHHEIQEDQVGLERGSLRQPVRPIDRLRDSKVGDLQEVPDHLPDELVIVHHEDPRRGHGRSLPLADHPK